MFRFYVVWATIASQLKRINHPHGVFPPQYAGRPIPNDVISAVMSFIFLFILCVMGLATALASLGLDPLTALSGAATAVANVGPGLGEVIGPSGTFAPLPDAAKWLLSLGMLAGRLELFTVLVLFSPALWRA